MTSLVYGSGAALTLDEFALWLNLEDDYWTKQGRESIDAVVLFGSLLSLSVSARASSQSCSAPRAPRRPPPRSSEPSAFCCIIRTACSALYSLVTVMLAP